MRICGLQKLTLLDFPGKVAATVFTGGCELRCPFCHNAPLVLGGRGAETLDKGEVLAFLASRRGLLDGVVLSGGEPLLQPDAPDFLAEVKAMGFAVKLDTNGCHPDVLEDVLDRRLADYVAMDVKNSLEKYPQTVGVPGFDTAPVERSARLLLEGGTDYEFRTTLVRPFHELSDMADIGAWLRGARRYFLQAFVDSGDLVGGGCSAFTAEEMEAFARAARPWAQTVGLRGV